MEASLRDYPNVNRQNAAFLDYQSGNSNAIRTGFKPLGGVIMRSNDKPSARVWTIFEG